MEPMTYAETAYDSSHPRTLAPALLMEKRSPAARRVLARKLEPLPVACGEFLMLADFGDLKYAKENPDGEHDTIPPMQLGWMGFENPMTWAMMAKFLAGFAGLICWFGAFVFIPISID